MEVGYPINIREEELKLRLAMQELNQAIVPKVYSYGFLK